jgi:hypothetical protein
MRNTKAQAKKEWTTSELQRVRSELLTEAAALSRKERDTVFLGVWSVRDMLAHLAGWDFANLDAAKSIIKGRLPSFYAHYDRDWQTFNAMLVKKYRRDTFREQRALLKRSQQMLVNYLQTLPPRIFQQRFRRPFPRL